MSTRDRRDAKSALPGALDTIAAIATARGRSALALVRVSGPAALDVAARVVRPWRDVPREAFVAALHDPESGDLIDRAVVTVYHAPASYTGEDAVEFGVHGGYLVPALTLSALLRAGAREALPGEFTRRAVLAGRMDILQAEAVADLVDAQSRAMHRVAIRQLDGSLSRRLTELREAILEVESLIAYDIDFPEEDEGPIAPERVDHAAARVLASLDALLATAHTGEVVRDGAVVVIAGPPNVGKSSLFNALLGAARAIVTDVPGTTRDALEAVVEVHGWPVRLVDTAGLRESPDTVERLGIEVSARYLGAADLVLACAEDPHQLEDVKASVSGLTEASVLTVRTKGDLVHSGDRAPAESDAIVVSAATGAGLDILAGEIAARLSEDNVDPAGELPLLARERHATAVARAREEVARFTQVRRNDSAPAVLAAVHLRAAAEQLEGLIGAVDVEDVLDRVFGSFCVGK